MSQKYKFYQSLWYSFYNMDFYLDVIKNGRGFAIKYLILISFIISTFWTYNQYIIVGEVINYYKSDINKENLTTEAQYIINILSQIPVIDIKDGVAKVDENLPKPYIIKDIYNNEVVFIDVNSNIMPEDKLFVMNKNQMMIMGQVKDLALMGNMVIDQELLIFYLKNLNILSPIVFFIFVIRVVLLNFFKVFFVTIFFSLLNDFLSLSKINFKAMFRVTIFTLIPAISFELIYSNISFLPDLKFMNLITYLITLAYLVSIIAYVKKQSKNIK